MRLTVERLGHAGDGIAAAADGAGPVLVAGALPGELVEGEVIDGHMARPRILSPSPDRVAPPCAHARSCGGCQLQHASDGFVAEWKRRTVARALAAQGLAPPLCEGVATSPPGTRRRATLSGRRTRGGALVGFHARASDRIVEVPGCLVLHPDLVALMPALHALVLAGATRGGEMSMTVTRTLTGADVAVTGGREPDRALREALARIAADAGIARLTWAGEGVAQAALPEVAIGRARVPFPPGAFLQATEEGEAALLSALREAVTGAARIADLFCGLGTFALPLAEAAEVEAHEGDAALVAALDHAARHTPGLRRLRAIRRDLFRRPLEPAELAGFDAVVIDPPRAGARAQAGCLAGSPVPVIAMASCNPATFARDAAILVAGGYRLEHVRVIDQFRWSAQVELAARFSRAGPAPVPARRGIASG